MSPWQMQTNPQACPISSQSLKYKKTKKCQPAAWDTPDLIQTECVPDSRLARQKQNYSTNVTLAGSHKQHNCNLQKNVVVAICHMLILKAVLLRVWSNTIPMKQCPVFVAPVDWPWSDNYWKSSDGQTTEGDIVHIVLMSSAKLRNRRIKMTNGNRNSL